MDKNVHQILQAIDRLEQDLKDCEHRLTAIGRMPCPYYFGVPTRARTGFAELYYALEHMRWIVGAKTLPPEG